MNKTSQQLKSDTTPSDELDVLRHRLEAQSFLNQSNETLLELKQWWRFTPSLNWAITLVGTVMAWPQLLFIQAALMLIATMTPSHPFDWVYNFGIRHITGTAKLPKSGRRRRIVFAMASVLISLLAIWFYLGYNLTGYIQGGIMTLLGGLLMAFNLCIASEILARIFGMPKQ